MVVTLEKVKYIVSFGGRQSRRPRNIINFKSGTYKVDDSNIGDTN